MKTKNHLCLAALGLSLILMAAIFAGCRNRAPDEAGLHSEFYVCAMHPSVKSRDPDARCPICGMRLEPPKNRPRTAGHDSSPAIGSSNAMVKGGFYVPLERLQQIGVTSVAITNKSLQRSIRTVGSVTVDPKRRWSYVSRVEGYVQEIKVASPGEQVENNQPLLTIYSPELHGAEQELLESMKSGRLDPKDKSNSAGTDHLVQSARKRLLRWNLTGAQVDAILEKGQASDTFALLSPFPGIVEEIGAEQGRRVMPGDRLVTVADLTHLWVWAEFYQEDVSLLQTNQTATLAAPDGHSVTWTGRIASIDPFLAESRRTARVRFEVENADARLLPGMYLNVSLDLNLGESLAVPASAVMPTGNDYLVFVDQGAGRLEARVVELGLRAGDDYPVKAGLAAGERVITSANFLIDAESRIQGARAVH